MRMIDWITFDWDQLTIYTKLWREVASSPGREMGTRRPRDQGKETPFSCWNVNSSNPLLQDITTGPPTLVKLKLNICFKSPLPVFLEVYILDVKTRNIHSEALLYLMEPFIPLCFCLLCILIFPGFFSFIEFSLSFSFWYFWCRRSLKVTTLCSVGSLILLWLS